MVDVIITIKFSLPGRNDVLEFTALGHGTARGVWDGLRRGGFEMKSSRP